MANKTYISGRPRPKDGGPLGRGESNADDERPFSEIRKNLHDILRMLALHRWAFFVPLSIVASSVFILSLYYPRLYRATASFERRNDAVSLNLPLSAGAASFDQYRSTIVRDLTSTDYMAEVVDNLGIITDPARNEDGSLTKASARRRLSLARSLGARLSVSTQSPSKNLDITKIIYTGPDPELGKKLVVEARATFIRRTKEHIYNYLTDQRQYWIDEANTEGEKLSEARRLETEFRLENPHADPTNPGAISLEIAQREMERRELQLRKREYESELSALKQILAATMPEVGINDARNQGDTGELQRPMVSPYELQLVGQIRDVDSEIEELTRTRGMTTLHPTVKDLLDNRRQLMANLERWRNSPKQGPDASPVTPIPAIAVAESPAQSDRARMLVQIAAQQAMTTEIDISLASNALAIEQVLKAKREVYEKQEENAEIMERVAKARQDYTERVRTIRSIDPAIKAFEKDKLLLFSAESPASGSFKPISPKATTVVLLALLAGVATGIVFVILAEILDHVYRSSNQVARSLGLPLLESIDEIVTSEDRRYIFLRKVVISPVVFVCFVGLTGLTGSMAYLSIEQPWTYEKLAKIPQTFLHLFAATP